MLTNWGNISTRNNQSSLRLKVEKKVKKKFLYRERERERDQLRGWNAMWITYILIDSI